MVRAARFQRGADGVSQDMPPVVTLAVCRGLRRDMVNYGVLAQMEAGLMLMKLTRGMRIRDVG